MIILKILLWVALLPMTLMSVSFVFALFKRETWSRPDRALTVPACMVAILMAPLTAYALLVDWGAVVWVGVLVLLMLGLVLATFATDMRQHGISLQDLRSQAVALARDANRIHPGTGGETEPAAGNNDNQPVREERPAAPRPVAEPAISTAPLYLRALAGIIAIELGLALLAPLGVLWLDPAHKDVTLPILFSLWILAHALQRLAHRDVEIPGRSRTDTATKITGIALYVAGIFLFGVILIESLFDAMDRTSLSQSTATTAVTSLLAGLGIGSAYVAQSLLRLNALRAASEIRSADPRPPVLYLRPFDREKRFAALRAKGFDAVRQIKVFGRLFNRLGRAMRSKAGEEEFEEIGRVLQAAHRQRTLYGRLSLTGIAQSIASGRGGQFDEQLIVAEIFNQLGPYVGISRPRESVSWSDVGAFKHLVPDEEWRTVVTDLIRDSQIIVIEAGTSRSLLWEFRQVVSLAAPRKVLLIVPEWPGDYAAFRQATAAVFPLPLPEVKPETRFFMFDDGWNPFPLLNQSDVFEDMTTRMGCAHVLRPFLERNGHGVAELVAPVT